MAAIAQRVIRLSDGEIVEDRRNAGRADGGAGVIRTETLSIALRGVLANKLRSSLTILGLTIGVASVIVLIAVGNGSSRAVQQRIEALGSNVLLITRGGTPGGSGASNAAQQPLTMADADRAEQLPERAGRGERVARGERQPHARARRGELLAVPVRGHHPALREGARLPGGEPAAASPRPT